MKRAAVLGSPIAHSLSPVLHRAAYRALGLDWQYDAFDVAEAALPGFVAALDERWAGLSLTMPLKQAVIPLLVEVDPLANTLQSVNTVLPADGGWRGTNTDVFGIVQALTEHAPGRQSAVIIGGGATARSALAALTQLEVAEIVVAARRTEQADEVVALAAALGGSCTAVPFEPDSDLLRRDIVISTLPGDAGADWAALSARASGVLLDASYHPWPTPLAGAWPVPRIASGRDMLLWQAVEQVRLMTGQSAPVAAMSAALAELEARSTPTADTI